MSLVDDFLKDVGDEVVAPRRPMQAPEQLSAMDKLLAKVPTGLVNNPAVTAARGFAMGAADPTVGAVQAGANLLPDSTGIPQGVNKAVNEKNATYQSEQGGGFDPARLAGNIASPVNLAMALRAAPAVTAGARAVQGGILGAAGGLTAPVEVGESGKFWGPKAVQVAAGGVGGAILAPLVGAVSDKVASLINRATFNPANAASDADSAISQALKEAGQKAEDLPAGQLDALKEQAVTALSKGQKLDPAAALRMADFNAENIKPTLGMVTRDPGQWAAEQNVKGVKGAGERVQQLIAEGNTGVVRGVGKYANDASEGYIASPKIADALRGIDEAKRRGVTTAYQTARTSEGKSLEFPTDDLRARYMQVVNDFGDKVPGAIQKRFGALGFRMDFENADTLRKLINDHVGNDKTTNLALDRLRSAVNDAQKSADASGGPFAPAVKLAAERFGMHEQVPAIADAVSGNVDDKFIQRQIINNPSTPQVQKLAALLREQAPEAFQEARQQVGAHLARAAFGENASGDKLVTQEGYNKALRTLGTGKLEAFFEPQEVEQMKRLGRIASYQVAPPAGSASNYSNTASTVANILRKLGPYTVVAKGPVQFTGDLLEGAAATRPKVPVTPNLTPVQRELIAKILTVGAGGAGLALAGIPGQQK